MARVMRKRTEATQSVHVRAVVRDCARRLVTLRDGYACWRDRATWIPSEYKEAIVRLIPPARATEEWIGATKAALLDAGAAAVRVMPKEASPDIGAPKANVEPARGFRQVVVDLVDRAVTEDREGLRSAVEEALAKVGL